MGRPKKFDVDKINYDLYNFTLSDIAQSILRFKGEYFSLEHFPFWYEIYDSPRLTTDVDQVYRKILFKCSRQVAKSTNCGGMGVTKAIQLQDFNIIVTQPTDKQVSQFSDNVLKKFNTESIVTNVWFKDTKVQRQIRSQGYANRSKIVLANIYNSVLSARGFPADMVIIDEVQDTPRENMEIIEAATSRSPYRIILHSGTPKTPENFIEQEWKLSTQTEWMIPCRGCGHWNGPIGGDGTDGKMYNVGKKGIICDKCGKRLHVADGEWVDGFAGRKVEGYHINELLVPRTAPGASSWLNILEKLGGGSAEAAFNEVLGVSYTSASKPFTEKLIRSICDPSWRYVINKSDVMHGKDLNLHYTFAGLDWAQETVIKGSDMRSITSYTILTIGGWDPVSRKIKVYFVKRYYDLPEIDADRPDEVLGDIISWVRKFNVKILGCDYGVGHKENQRLKDELGLEHVMEFQYMKEMDDSYTYDFLANKWIVNRTQAIDDLKEAMHKKEFIFAKYEGETSEYADDLYSVYRSHDKLRRTKYDKTRADDWLHGLVYMLLACRYCLEDPRFTYVYKNRGDETLYQGE